MRERYRHLHFVGIGGAGMSGLAEIAIKLGYRVSGSDVKASAATERLERLGATVSIGHDEAQGAGAQVIVYSSAVPSDNPELVAARRRGVPTIPRAEMLAELARRKDTIAVAGTHGKTTTTAMVGAVLVAAGLDPTIVVGARVPALGSSARLGDGDFFVAEADESDGSFLELSPTIAVVTTVDAEHLDFYGSLDRILDAFVAFVDKVPFYGAAVLCLDQPNIRAMVPRIDARIVTYGLDSDADLVARRVEPAGLAARFEAVHRGAGVGECTLAVPGRHNVANALAAIAVGLELEVGFPTIQKALAGFTGAERRFQVRGAARGVTVVDDYGHHPAEIRATLGAARTALDGRIVTVFQPHRYTRTLHLRDEFVGAFDQADVLLVLDIYSAGEAPIAGVSAEGLADAIRAHGHHSVTFVGDRARAVGHLLEIVRPGDLVLTLGAGDVGHLGPELLTRLEMDPAHGRTKC
jgi:UDP-N-acetylmuramate--alanine ligase